MEELLSGLSLFRRSARDELLQTMAQPGAAPGALADQALRLLALAKDEGLSGNLWQTWLSRALLLDENPWSLACEGSGDPGGSLGRLARRDAELLLPLLRCELPGLPDELRAELLDFRPGEGMRPTGAGLRILRLRSALCAAEDADAFAAALAKAFRCGAGELALHRAFRAGADGALHPIPDVQSAPLSALVGYEPQKRLLQENTEAFLAGRESNHALLYGDAGTGKSTCIRALLTEYADSPLRLVELQRGEFGALPALLSRLRQRSLRFLLFIDDLSFEEHETEYKHLKAAIEGGLETMPENVRIYATSNRRHLIRETWADRSDMEHDGDLHHSDTVEEKLSLAGRFGLTIRFDSPDRRLYNEIVDALAERQGLALDPAELHRLAAAWEIRHGGPTGRTAQQFIDDLAGKSE